MHRKIIYRWLSLLTLVFLALAMAVKPLNAQSERPIMAFYYPWYEMTDWTYSKMSDLPVPQYSGGEDATLRRHIQQARDAGIDTLICTWYGPNETRLNARCKRLQELMAEMGNGLKIAIIPDQSAWGELKNVDNLANALAVLQTDFMSKPTYQTFQGKPVVFWFYPPSLGDATTWKQLRAKADPNRQQFWFGGTEKAEYLEVFDTLYFFDITWEKAPGRGMASYKELLEGTNRPFVATVMPGYDDLAYRNGHQRLREDGAYYRGTWEDAIKYKPAAVVLTSFNEFFEGSHIEPSEKYGDLYLRLTKEMSDKFRASLGTQPSSSPTIGATSSPTVLSTASPTIGATSSPTAKATKEPTLQPTLSPTTQPLTLTTQPLTLTTSTPTVLPTASPAPANCRHFSATNFEVCGRILEFWNANGGLEIFGNPIGPQREEVLEGKPVQAQWFERTRLELHPENPPPFDVLLGRLGADMLQRQGRKWQDFPKAPGYEACRFFAETGHYICDYFQALWRFNGIELDGQLGKSVAENLALFGLPLSSPQVETLSDGKQYTVQWFERARFEMHPENPPPYEALLGLLGNELLALGPEATATPTITPTSVATATPTAIPTATPKKRKK